MSRRARVTPEMVGLPVYGTKRRVEGLRRGEVATLSGISTEYYVRLERGDASGASISVIENVARVLQLNGTERQHLANLLDAVSTDRTASGARVARALPRGQQPERRTVRQAVQRLLDSFDTPAFVFNRRLDIVAANQLGRLLYAPMFEKGFDPVNAAMFAFLAGDVAKKFWPEWTDLADNVVAELRAEAGRDPYDADLVHIIGHLSTQSEDFRVRWASHNVRGHANGSKTLHHPVVGTITLPFEKFTVFGDDDQFVMTYLPEPETPAHDALKLLGSWGHPPNDFVGRDGTRDIPREAGSPGHREI